MKHEKLQKYHRSTFSFPKGAPIADIVAALVDQKEYAYATETLFGCARGDGAFFSYDRFQGAHYMALWIGRYPDMLKEMAKHHRWQSQRANKGYSFEVFPGEWLVIPEPHATGMLKELFGS